MQFEYLTPGDLENKEPVAHFRIVTPEMAKWVMENRHPKNRTLKLAKIAQLTGDMNSDQFKLNGEAVVFGADGNMLDGQHRFQACIDTGISFVTNISFGIDPEAMATIDQGAARLAGDVLGMEGYAHPRELASAARMIVGFESTDGKRIDHTAKCSRADILDIVSIYPKLVQSIKWARTFQAHVKLAGVNVSTLGFAHFILTDRYDPAMVEYYLERVAVGDKLGVGDPAFAVRGRLNRPDVHQNQQRVEAMFRGWNYQVRGKTISNIPLQGELPRLASMQHLKAAATAKAAGYVPVPPKKG